MSELKLDLHDKTLDLNQELNELKTTHQAMKAQMDELRHENGDLEEEACSLFDKVNSNNYDTSITKALCTIKFLIFKCVSLL